MHSAVLPGILAWLCVFPFWGGGAGASSVGIRDRSCTFADADRCFADTNLLVLGSSTSRHWFFVLREVLDGDRGPSCNRAEVGFVAALAPSNKYAVGYRKEEIRMCGGGKLQWSTIDTVKTSLPHMRGGPRCSMLLERTKTLLNFVWHLPFRIDEATALGTASKVLLSDTQRNNLTVSRILINGGLELSINVKNGTQSWIRRTMTETLPHVVSAMRPVLDAGGSVTWRTATQVCCQKKRVDPATGQSVCVNKDNVDMDPVSNRLRTANQEAVHQLAEMEPRVSILDSWALTDRSKCPAYEDWVHHPPLAFEQLEWWMQDQLSCTCTGAPRSDPTFWERKGGSDDSCSKSNSTSITSSIAPLPPATNPRQRRSNPQQRKKAKSGGKQALPS